MLNAEWRENGRKLRFSAVKRLPNAPRGVPHAARGRGGVTRRHPHTVRGHTSAAWGESHAPRGRPRTVWGRISAVWGSASATRGRPPAARDGTKWAISASPYGAGFSPCGIGMSPWRGKFTPCRMGNIIHGAENATCAAGKLMQDSSEQVRQRSNRASTFPNRRCLDGTLRRSDAPKARCAMNHQSFWEPHSSVFMKTEITNPCQSI